MIITPTKYGHWTKDSNRFHLDLEGAETDEEPAAQGFLFDPLSLAATYQLMQQDEVARAAALDIEGAKLRAGRSALRADYATLPLPLRVAFQGTFTLVDRALDDRDYEVAVALIQAVQIPAEGMAGVSQETLEGIKTGFVAAIQGLAS